MDPVWLEKLAIQELCARYCLTIDAHDAQGWADCFTPDGVFEFDGWAIAGRDALRDYAEAHGRSLRSRHMTIDLLYDVHGDRAHGRAASLVTLATPAGYRILSTGEYRDQLVRHDGRWLIARRKLSTDRLTDRAEQPVGVLDPEAARLVAPLDEIARRLGRQVEPS